MENQESFGWMLSLINGQFKIEKKSHWAKVIHARATEGRMSPREAGVSCHAHPCL